MIICALLSTMHENIINSNMPIKSHEYLYRIRRRLFTIYGKPESNQDTKTKRLCMPALYANLPGNGTKQQRNIRLLLIDGTLWETSTMLSCGVNTNSLDQASGLKWHQSHPITNIRKASKYSKYPLIKELGTDICNLWKRNIIFKLLFEEPCHFQVGYSSSNTSGRHLSTWQHFPTHPDPPIDLAVFSKLLKQVWAA